MFTTTALPLYLAARRTPYPDLTPFVTDQHHEDSRCNFRRVSRFLCRCWRLFLYDSDKARGDASDGQGQWYVSSIRLSVPQLTITQLSSPATSVSTSAGSTTSQVRLPPPGPLSYTDRSSGGAADARDPIADVEGCKRDIEKFKSLGLNTIRVYTVDNTANHDECMKALADAGIYLALDVNTPKYSINRAEPEVSYNKVYLQSIFATIDAFQDYDNTLLFFSGNEVINDDMTTTSAPYVKAVTRDIKSYINSRGYRKIPVGYSAADVDSNRFEMAQYMNCGDDSVRSDFFAFNDYSWCDPSSFQISGWDQKVKKYKDYSIPLL